MAAGNTSENLGTSVGMDTTAFKKGVSELNSQIRSIETNFRASAAVMGSWSEKSDGIKMRVDSLSEKLDLQKKKLSTLQAEYNKAINAEERDEKAIASLADQMFVAERAITSTENGLKKYNAQLESMSSPSKKATDDAKKLGDAMDKAGKQSSGFGESIKSGFSKLGSGLATGVKAAGVAVAGMGAAAVAAATGVYKLAEKASDLNEAQNVVQQTFKASSDSVIKWTDTITQSAGLGKTAATNMVGSMGAMMKSSGLSEQAAAGMSEKMVQLTGDMASFYNLDNDTAWEKIRSGISGETEPLKQLGINMSVANLSAYALSQGINKSYDKMTQAEQTTLRYNYLLSVTKDAQGDFARTAGGMANQSRLVHENLSNLAQTMGGKLLPSVNSMIPSFNGLLSSFTAFINTGTGTEQVTSSINNLVTSIKSAVTQMLPQITGIMTALAQLIGQALPAVLPQLLQVATSTLTTLVSLVVKSIPTILPAISEGIVQLINSVTQSIQQNGPLLINAAVQAITTIATGLVNALPQIAQAAVQIIISLANTMSQQLPTLIPVALNAIISIYNALLSNIPQLVQAAIQLVEGIVQGLINALPKLLEAAPQMIITIINGLVASLPKLIEAAPKIIVSLIMGIIKALPQLIEATPKIIIALITGLIQALPELITMGPKILSELWNGLKSQNWGEIGSNILKGIIDGFGQIGNWIWGKIQEVGSSIVNGFKSFFGIHSPSRLMKDEVGKFIGQGVIEGVNETDFMSEIADILNKNSDKPKVAAQKVADLVASEISAVKDKTAAQVAGLNAELAKLGVSEKKALTGTKGAHRQAIEAEYNAKKQSVKNQIALRKQQADKEIAEIQRIGKASKDELAQELQDRKDFVSSVNSLNDEIKSALKSRYEAEEKDQENVLNKELDNLEDWKTQSENTINAVYKVKEDAIQAAIDALDKETAAQERADKHKEYTNKINDLKSQIAYSHDDYNKSQLQKQLATEQAAYQKQLDSEAVADKKASLEQQKTDLEKDKQAQLDSINSIYTARKKSISDQLAALKEFYQQATTDAALEAQSEQLIMQGNQESIVALLNSYGDQYKQAGQTLGGRLAEGFQPAIDNIKGMISSITAEISAARDNALSALATAQQVAATASGSNAASSNVNSHNNNSKSVSVTVYPSKKESTAEAMQSARIAAQQIQFAI